MSYFQGESIETKAHFTSLPRTILNQNDINDAISTTYQELHDQVADWESEGSNWRVEEILSMDFAYADYNPIRASSFLELPNWIKRKQAVLNIENTNNHECFKYCVLAAINNMNSKDPDDYRYLQHTLSFNDVEFPTTVEMVSYNSQEIYQINNFTQINPVSVDRLVLRDSVR